MSSQVPASYRGSSSFFIATSHFLLSEHCAASASVAGASRMMMNVFVDEDIMIIDRDLVLVVDDFESLL